MTEADLTNFEKTASNVLRPALAFAAASSPVTAAGSFGLELVFRALRLRAKITKAKEDAAAGLATGVAKTGLLRIPVITATPAARLKATFSKNPLFAADFPEVATQFKPEIDRLRSPGAPTETVAVLRVVEKIILPLYVDPVTPLRFGDADLQSLFGDLIGADPPDLRRIVTEFRALDRHRDLVAADSAINNELISLQAGLAIERLEGLSDTAEKDLAAAIRQAVVTELLGTSSAITASAKFVATQRILKLADEDTATKAEVAALKARSPRSQPQQDRLDTLEQNLKSIQAMKASLEGAIK